MENKRIWDEFKFYYEFKGDIKRILNHNALFSVHTTLYNQYVNIEVS